MDKMFGAEREKNQENMAVVKDHFAIIIKL